MTRNQICEPVHTNTLPIVVNFLCVLLISSKVNSHLRDLSVSCGLPKGLDKKTFGLLTTTLTLWSQLIPQAIDLLLFSYQSLVFTMLHLKTHLLDLNFSPSTSWRHVVKNLSIQVPKIKDSYSWIDLGLGKILGTNQEKSQPIQIYHLDLLRVRLSSTSIHPNNFLKGK